jgi:hypothetical protein
MTDLKQAAQQALEFLMTRRMGAEAVIESLNEALAREHAMHELARLGQEIEQGQAEPTPWRDMVVVSLVREGINKHRARELADHFATPPAAQRPWVGLEIEEVQDSYNRDYQAQTRAIEAKLKERNT